MSLSMAQKAATRCEFARNFELLGLSPSDAAADLGVSASRIEDIMNLKHVRQLEDVWVLRAYLIDQAERRGIELAPFTALAGDPAGYWFLDASRIAAMLLDE